MRHFTLLLLQLAHVTTSPTSSEFLSAKWHAPMIPDNDLLIAPWHAPWMPHRDDLRCITSPDDNLWSAQAIDNHCRCNSSSIFHNNATPLHIKILSLTGTNLVLNASAFDNGTFYHIDYPGKHLKEFPSNLCSSKFNTTSNRKSGYTNQFSNILPFRDHIVQINFSDNAIKDLIDVNCLTRLDVLDLSYNRIIAVSNTSFNKLTYLRELYLQNNLIKHMDLSVVSNPQLTLQYVDLGNNLLTELDISNLMSPKPFCVVSYDSNNLKAFHSQLHTTLDPDRHIGLSGSVILNGNEIETFPDLKTLLNLNSLSEFGSLLKVRFAFHGIPLTCDCNLAPFMDLVYNEIVILLEHYVNVFCHAPPDMKNVSVKDFVSNPTNLDRLTCDLTNKTITPPCPERCTCIDQPHQNRLLINCSGRGLTKLPEYLPHSKYSSTVDIDLSDNEITSIFNVSYLSSITHISLANNNIQHIDSAAAYMLSNASLIDLGGNPNLNKLPSELQYRKNSTIILTNNTLDCDCDSTWIQRWTQNSRSSFLCRVPGHGLMPSSNFSQTLLDCDQTVNKLIVLNVLLGIAALSLIMAGIVSYRLRYEIYILLVRAKQVNKNAVLPMLHYDAYLSFDEENDDLRIWAHTILVHHLEKMDYKLFVPLRDLQSGDVRQLNTIKVLQKTKTFLIILSESYTTQDHDINWQNQEWQYGWNMFKASRMKNIVMINYDQILASEVRHAQIKAFLRVGNPVDFTNTRRDILQQICQRLGPPNKWHSKPKLTTRNRKTALQVDQLFLTHPVRQEQHKHRQELLKQREELDKQRKDLNKHREDTDRNVLKHGVLIAKDDINKEYTDNIEYDDRNIAGDDLAQQRQKMNKQSFRDAPMSSFAQVVTIGSDNGLHVHREDEAGDQSELAFASGDILVTEKPRTAEDQYTYYV